MADDAGELARLATDPSTPLTTLQQLAQDHPELRAAIAANPSTYPALLDWLGRLGMPDVDAALARRTRLDTPIHEPRPAPQQGAAEQQHAAAAESQQEAEAEQQVAAAEQQPTAPSTDAADTTGGREVEIDDRPTLVRPAVAGSALAAGQRPDAEAENEPEAPEKGQGSTDDESPTGDTAARPDEGTPGTAGTGDAPEVTAHAAEPVADDGQPFDPNATAVFTDPDLVRGDHEAAPPTFAPTEPVERPAEATPTDAPTEVFRPVRAARPERAAAAPVNGPAGGDDTTGARPQVFGFDPPTPTPPGGLRTVTATSDPEGRRPMWMLLALVGLLLLIALIWILLTRGGDEAEAPPATTAATATASTTEEPTASTSAADESPGDIDATRAALVALPDATTCDDPAGDSGVVNDFAEAAAPGGTWQDPASGEVVLTALRGLQDSCDPAYAVAVEQALLNGPDTPTAVVTTLNSAEEWVELARPAPPGAQERASFTSPSANIACTLGTDAAACTIVDREFADPEGCSAGPVTLTVGLSGSPAPDCSAGPVTGNGVLEYGQSATSGYFACTSEEDGVTCWSTLTGQGFSVARAAFQTF